VKVANQPAKVLVIDDAPGVRELLHIHLSNAGYEVALAEDAIAGGHMLLESPPDLVIVDARMPYMSGYEFAAALSADEQTRHIPVVFLSADPEVHEKTKTLPAAACLSKPVTTERLLQVVALFAPPAGGSTA
jgi:CheY-like chemotaxis protein